MVIVICILFVLAILAFLYWKLASTDIPLTGNEERVIPLGEPWDFHNRTGHSGGPPLKDWE